MNGVCILWLKIKDVSQNCFPLPMDKLNTRLILKRWNTWATFSSQNRLVLVTTHESPLNQQNWIDNAQILPGVPSALLNLRNGTQKRDNRQSIGVIDRRRFVTTITAGERERAVVVMCVSQGHGRLISSLLSPTYRLSYCLLWGDRWTGRSD